MTENGYTQKDVADKLGIKKQSVTGWMSGGCPSKKNLKKLAELFKCEIIDLADVKATADIIKRNPDPPDCPGICEKLRPEEKELFEQYAKLNDWERRSCYDDIRHALKKYSLDSMEVRGA
jgi:transcriptional regulator with XRE-family HTH domain